MLARIRMWGVATLAILLGYSSTALAEETAAAAPPPPFDSGTIAWMLTSSALVLMMTAPGLALFYGDSFARKTFSAFSCSACS